MRTTDLGQPRQSKYCKCGHLKDEHNNLEDGNIQCSRCKCFIDFE